MPSFLNSIEFENENGEVNKSNGLLDNQLMVLEFALLDKKIVKIIASTSLGMKVLFGISQFQFRNIHKWFKSSFPIIIDVFWTKSGIFGP